MKKLLSLVFALAVMTSFATTASASISFSGDAQVRPRGEFVETKADGVKTSSTDNLYWLYRLRLKVAADLGDGYFAKALLASESYGWFAALDGQGGFPDNLADDFGVSQMYFGRMMEHSHYMAGYMPVNSFNNPIYDLAVFPSSPLGIPYFLLSNDRIFGLNYGTKVGPGELNATLCVLDNDMRTENVFEDAYALHLMYKTNIGDITIDPQLLAAITDSDLLSMGYDDITPITLGSNVVIPAGDFKFTISGFYTFCEDSAADIDYDAYLVRLKAERGPIRAWVDYSAMNDDSMGKSDEYTNMYLWAQYNWKVHESSMGSLTLSPTVRYRTRELNNGAWEDERLRTELWAQVAF